MRALFTLRRAHWPFTQVNTQNAWHCALTLMFIGAAHAQPKLQIKAGEVATRVSPMHYGIMTEEINCSYDGGIYAEQIPLLIGTNPKNVRWPLRSEAFRSLRGRPGCGLGCQSGDPKQIATIHIRHLIPPPLSPSPWASPIRDAAPGCKTLRRWGQS